MPSAGWRSSTRWLLITNLSPMPALILKPGREKSLLRRHPWIFSGALERIDGDPRSGETVDVLDAKGRFLARAAYSPSSQIRARVWTFDPLEQVDADFFHFRILKALGRRATLGLLPVFEEWSGLGKQPATDAFRLIHAESDNLPGLIVDRYGDVLVLQSLTAGSEFWRETIADILLEETGAASIYERSDADVRELEGLIFELLRKFRDQARSFDMIILDPPKFAATSAQAEKASRGYKDINLLAFKLLRKGGILVTFSCSGGIDADLFQKIVAGAALDAGVDAQIVEHLSQGGDHPVSLHFPEGAYLKGLVCLKG